MERPTFFSAAVGSRVNREAGVIEGVSVITAGVVAKGRNILIDDETLRQVKECAETYSDGVQVKVDHGTGFSSIVGALRKFRIEGNKLLADLHLLKSAEGRDRLFEIAETMAGSIGLSIVFTGNNEKIDGKEYARCTELYSVDFVSRPAANPSGLFSRVDSPPQFMDSKSLITKFKEFLTGVEKELEPVNFEAQTKDLAAKLDAATKDLAAKDAEIKELTEIKDAVEKVKTEFAEKQKTLADEIEKQSSAKAAIVLATLGIPQAKSGAPNQTSAKNFEALLAEYRASNPTASKSQAIQFCIKQHPAQYLECKNDPARISKL